MGSMDHLELTLTGLRKLFAFGVPGGQSKVQKLIGQYLDGDDEALKGMPTVKRLIDEGVEALKLNA